MFGWCVGMAVTPSFSYCFTRNNNGQTAVGWAKAPCSAGAIVAKAADAVSTGRVVVWNGGHASLCPPYELRTGLLHSKQTGSGAGDGKTDIEPRRGRLEANRSVV